MLREAQHLWGVPPPFVRELETGGSTDALRGA